LLLIFRYLLINSTDTKTIQSILIIGSLISAFLVVDTRYAHSDQELKREQQQVQSLKSFRIDYLMDKLNELDTKEIHQGISTWEKARKLQIQRELDKLLKEK